MRAIGRAFAEVGPVFALVVMTFQWALGVPAPTGAWRAFWLVWATALGVLGVLLLILTWAVDRLRSRASDIESDAAEARRLLGVDR